MGGAFVTSKWLDEVFRLGDLPLSSDPVSLEENFELPPEAKYRPEFDDSLPSERKTAMTSDPNEERINMFSRYHFICVGEAKRQISSELRELLSRGQAKIEVFDITGGAEKWRKAILRAKAKAGQNLVPITDQRACEAAIGEDAWKELVETTRVCFTPRHLEPPLISSSSFELGFSSHEDIIQAVLKADTSVFNFYGTVDAAPSSSSLPHVIPNTHPDESSLVPEPEEPEEPTPPPGSLSLDACLLDKRLKSQSLLRRRRPRDE
ncbi:hypothetical protein K438DRAFT_2033058 [Mycena galopus ATCC 62051]|nr:hypothetical protein K438DRAFT_2033058 [Mycena galopus ATCC 62051]